MTNEEKVLTVHHLTGEPFTVNVADIEEISIHPSGEGSQITTALGMVDVRENAADLTVQIQRIDTPEDH